MSAKSKASVSRASTEPTAASAGGLWIRSPGWDGFWILSGFWVPTLLVLMPLPRARALIVGLTLCCWMAHRISSLYLGLCVSEYREVLRARPGYFLLLPLGLLAATMAFVLCPESLLPLPRLDRFVLLALIDYFFSLYHFASQHYGVLAVYRGRLSHGQAAPGLLKWDRWACFGVTGIVSLLLDAIYDSSSPLRMLGLTSLDGLNPVWLRTGLATLVLGFWGATLLLYRRRQQGAGRIAYFSTLCYMTLLSIFVDPLLYFAIAQIQHWLVSLGLTTHMASNSHGTGTGWYRPWNWLNRRRGGPLMLLLGLSLLLTPILEADAYLAQGYDSGAVIVQNFLAAWQGSIWLSVFGALAIFSSLLHYIYDRGVFRFADPLTRRTAIGLLRRPDASQAAPAGDGYRVTA